MRVFFKYEFGYVNIDDKNIYLTNSGNWSETAGLSESSGITSLKSWIKVAIGIALILVASLFILVSHLSDLSTRTNDILGIILVAFVPFSIYKIYKSFRSDLGKTFKIPFDKVISLEFSETENGSIVRFRNGKNIEERFFINNLKLDDHLKIKSMIETK